MVNVTSKSVPRRAEEVEEPPKKKVSNVASRLSDNDATTEQNLHKDFLNVKLTGNPHTSEKGGSEEAMQRVSGSGPLQRDEEARGDPLPQLVGQGRNRDGPQHRDMELQPGKDLSIETSTKLSRFDYVRIASDYHSLPEERHVMHQHFPDSQELTVVFSKGYC